MKKQNENTVMDDVIECGVILVASYMISKVMKVAIARGESMLPTIKHNHPILLDCRQSRKHRIKAQDIVAFRPHLKNQHTFFLKRVIAIAGDVVRLEANQLFVNDVLIEESYLNEPMKQRLKICERVPSDHVFVLGDNRQHSLDSRSTKIGCVPLKEIEGVSIQFKR